MAELTPRNIDILRIIVQEFLETGDVLGSKALLKKYALGVSSATVRNDMAYLEELQLVFQPYNSAGRLPTAKGLRAFVNYLMQSSPDHFLEEGKSIKREKNIKEIGDFLHKIVYELSEKTGEIAFCIVPEKSIHEHVGVGTFLRKNQKKLGESILHIVDMVEHKFTFSSFIEKLPFEAGVNVFIGEENILHYLKDYTFIIKPIMIDGEKGYIGIIGSLQMNYSFNISAVRGII